MVGVRNWIVLGVVGIAACHRAGTQSVVGADAAVAPHPDAGTDTAATPDLAIEKAPPAVELCGNGLDDDGDGMVDEGCICTPGTTQDCFPGAERLAGVGVCAAG